MHTLHRRTVLGALAASAALAPWPGLAQSASPGTLPVPAGPMRLKGQQLDGTPFDLDALKGQVALVFFWTTRSSVARDELPEVRRNFEGWRGKGFHLVTVSDDPLLQDALDYERAVGMSMPVQNQVTKRFPRLWRREPGYTDSFGPLREYPVSFLVGRNGGVAKAFKGRLGNAGWDEIAEVLLT